MNEAIGTVWNVVSGIFANIGQNRYASDAMRIQHNAVFVEESQISIQPKVMAGAAFLLVIILIVTARK